MRIAVAGPAKSAMRADPWAVVDVACREARAAGAELLVLPEWALHGAPAPAEQGAIAEPSDGPAAARLQRVARAHAIAIIAGYAEACSGRIHSSALLVDTAGVAIANYRRTHITPDEQEFVSRGHWLTMMPVASRRVGIVIGYDALFPEPMRGLTLAGADLILGLGAGDPETAQRSGRILGARAQENEVPIAWSAWHAGGSSGCAILDPHGLSVGAPVTASAADIVTADLDRMARPTQLRLDRRPRLYQRLANLDGVDAPGRAV